MLYICLLRIILRCLGVNDMDNIIDIELTGRSTRRDQKLWQYDYGQVLRIAGKDFPKVTEVQFSLRQSGGHTLDRIGTSNNGLLTVQIPNELLQNKGATSDYTIYAFVYLTGDGCGNTKYMIQLPVESRPEPTDPSEDPSIDPSIFEDAINAVNASADRAEAAEKSAKESADKAKEYAESAGKSKGDVEEARDNAISAIGTEKESSLRGIESKTVESLQKIHSQTEESQNSIKQSIADATQKKTELDGAISNATDAKGNLDKAVQSAGNAKAELDTSVGKAGEAKMALGSSINSAGEKQLALDTTVEQANTVDASLKEHIGSAEQIQANVEQIAKNKADISALNEDLDYKIGKTAVGERELKFTNTGYVNASDGTISSSQNAQNTGFCRIDGVSRIIVHVSLSEAGAKIAFYSRNKEYLKDISIIPAITDPTYTETDLDITSDVYANAKYCIISNYGSVQKIAKVIGTVAPYSAKAIAEEAKAIAEEAKAIAKKHYGTFSIIGDSYSSFKGYMANANAATWYPASDHNFDDTNDVENVEQTWWYKFANNYKSRLLENNSWSGSAISYDGYSEGLEDGKETSFIQRMNMLTTPQLILVYGGTNDSWVASDTKRDDFLGEYKYSDFSESDFIYFRPALAYLLDKLKHKHIGAKIIFMLNSYLGDIKVSVHEICEHYGVDVCEISNIDLAHSHPTENGMTSIAEQLIRFLQSNG